jgi:hypothetical protein
MCAKVCGVYGNIYEWWWTVISDCRVSDVHCRTYLVMVMLVQTAEVSCICGASKLVVYLYVAISVDSSCIRCIVGVANSPGCHC